MVTEEMLCRFLKRIIGEKKVITLREFIDILIPNEFDLDEDDYRLSETRPGEMMYEQRARNIKSHNTFPVNVEYINKTFILKE